MEMLQRLLWAVSAVGAVQGGAISGFDCTYLLDTAKE